MRYPWKKAMDIASEFGAKHGITLEELRQAPSSRTFTQIRQALAARLRRETTLSWSEIGALVGRENYRGRRPARRPDRRAA